MFADKLKKDQWKLNSCLFCIIYEHFTCMQPKLAQIWLVKRIQSSSCTVNCKWTPEQILHNHMQLFVEIIYLVTFQKYSVFALRICYFSNLSTAHYKLCWACTLNSPFHRHIPKSVSPFPWPIPHWVFFRLLKELKLQKTICCVNVPVLWAVYPMFVCVNSGLLSL